MPGRGEDKIGLPECNFSTPRDPLHGGGHALIENVQGQTINNAENVLGQTVSESRDGKRKCTNL